MKTPNARIAYFMFLISAVAVLLTMPGLLHAQVPNSATADPELHRAARQGDLAALRTHLQNGADPNTQNAAGRTALLEAIAAGQTEAARVLLDAGAKVDAKSPDGRTPLIEAAAHGQLDAVQLLISRGADLDIYQRGSGTALATAERMGHNDVAAMLRQAGARSTGRSPGDMVCVRPWKGDGYCGTVESVNKAAFTIRVTKIMGCVSGCTARSDCSAGKTVGGAGGLKAGDEITTVSSCLTHTGVQP